MEHVNTASGITPLACKYLRLAPPFAYAVSFNESYLKMGYIG
jgi:hypothetical protein